MFKNKKGFTLVELLAAIVILGILSVFAIPMITGMVENSRNKMYVDDALKLIARAEYQMKASSNTINKPDVGDCIIISMAYLQANEIVTAPNGGEYDKDQSYVVIKNSGNGKLEYAATIIEKLKKGGYKGIKLTPYSNLLAANAPSHVVPIDEDELVEDIEQIKTAYIKNELGAGYIPGKLVAIYHYHEVKDASIQTVTSSDPYFVGEPESNRNELVARISFKVNDEDTARTDLKVYYSALEKNYTTAHEYGSNPVYSFEINFGEAPYGYGHDQARDIPIYIKVEDPEGNFAERVHHYTISANNPPSINDAFITKRQNDTVALLDATVTLNVGDDIDDVEDLLICAKDSLSSEGVTSGCPSYSKYSGGEKKVFDYHFYCGGSCTRDGKPHYLTIFVRDSLGAESLITRPYTFSLNTPPRFTSSLLVTSDTETYPSEGNKKVHVTVKATDDLTNLNRIKVYLSEDNENWREYNYSDDSNQNNFLFEFSGKYDGIERKIYAKLRDDEGAFSDVVSANYSVFLYEGPQLSHFEVTSDGFACDRGNICPLEDGGTKNGSKNALINVDVVDYLEAESDYSNISVCVSENRADCNNNANFKSYADNYKDKPVSYQFNNSEYDGSTKKMYAVVKDNEGHFDEAEATYVLYKDSKPQVLDFDLSPATGNFTEEQGYSTKAYLNISAIDDFTNEEDLLFTLKKNGTVVLQDQPISILSELIATGEVGEDGNPTFERVFNYQIQVSDSYDGQTYHFEVTVKDNKGYVSSAKTYDYKVFLNSCPQVEGPPRIQFASNNYGVNSNFLDLYFYPRFKDDVDKQFKVTYCYQVGSETPYCMNPVYSAESYHLTQDNLFSMLDYTGQTVKVYATVEDSLDPECLLQTDPVSFKIHNKAGKPEILYSSATYVPTSHVTPTEPDPDNPDPQPEPDPEPQDVTVYFQIRDLFDTYQVCISENSSGAQCTNFIGPDGTSNTYFDGTELDTYHAVYSYSGEITSSSNVYLFAKGKADPATTNYSKATISITAAGTCTVKDVNNSYYEYTYAGNGSKININDCQRKCYKYNFITNESNTSFSKNYNIKIKYRDLNHPENSFCSSFEETKTAVPMYCDFKDCFYNDVDDNYEQNAVGIVPIDDEVPWTEEIDGIIYVNYSHYNLYRSVYIPGYKDITLIQQGSILSPYCVDNQKYPSDFTYVRVADY